MQVAVGAHTFEVLGFAPWQRASLETAPSEPSQRTVCRTVLSGCPQTVGQSGKPSSIQENVFAQASVASQMMSVEAGMVL